MDAFCRLPLRLDTCHNGPCNAGPGHECPRLNPTSSRRLSQPVDPTIDHVLGDEAAEFTLVEYGSFGCPYCQAAHEVIANLRDRFGPKMRYVFRHRPITGNADALAAAEFVEVASESSDNYWTLHDRLMKRGGALSASELPALAAEWQVPWVRTDPGLRDEAAPSSPRERNAGPVPHPLAAARVQRDRDSAAASGARVSPTFFINGRRYEGAWDEANLVEAIRRTPGHRVQVAALEFARWAPSTGLLLLVMSLLALALANSTFGPAFEAFWLTPVGFAAGAGGEGATLAGSFMLPLRDWINDGLLTIFFLVVGLEIKREFTIGRLANARAAALPIVAALGGMLTPAAIYLLFVGGSAYQHGWAIPTTTDTAFAVALIAVLGDRVPIALRVFLTAAVVVDDLAAIAVVAVFYSGHLSLAWIVVSIALTVGLMLLSRSGVYRALPYAIGGVLLWTALHASGLHATLAGVIVALVTPTRPPANLRALLAQAEAVISAEVGSARGKVLRHGPSEPALIALDAIHDRIESPAAKMLRHVEPWSSYAVLPVFALANAGVVLSAAVVVNHPALVSAIVAGLVIGKLLGIVGGAWLAVRFGLADKPDDYDWRQLAGAAALAGIGFTMSLYISGKAFSDPDDFAAAKIAVFIASTLAAVVGTAILWPRRAEAAAAIGDGPSTTATAGG